MYQPGDILFYCSGNGNWQDTIIACWTRSSFVHVAIAISEAQKIEALAGGVVLSPIDAHLVSGVFSYQEHAQPFIIENMDAALAWLHSQIGQQYGWGDILNAGLERFEQVVSVNIEQHFDCSGLACEFLLKAGGIAALQPISDAHQITPARLAQLLHVGEQEVYNDLAKERSTPGEG